METTPPSSSAGPDVPPQLAKWARVRALGRLRFVLVQGCLMFGVSVATLTSLWDYVWLDAFSWPVAFTKLPMWLAAGAAWGLWMWLAMEKNWRKHVGDAK